MSTKPAGTSHVVYRIMVHGGDVDFVQIGSQEASAAVRTEAAYDALEAAADAALAHMQAAYPTETVTAERINYGTNTGDVWPTS